MRTLKPLIAVLLGAMVLMLGLRSSEAQHPIPQPGVGSPPAHRLAEMCATAFDGNVAIGRGFGMAFVADQNGYPGPLHVLELKDRLTLSGEQEAKVQAMLAAMFAESRPKSERLLEAEAKLRQLFATGQADEAAVSGGGGSGEVTHRSPPRPLDVPPEDARGAHGRTTQSLSRGTVERASADGSAWSGLPRCRRSDEVVTHMKEIEE
jgi:hypothetical protein